MFCHGCCGGEDERLHPSWKGCSWGRFYLERFFWLCDADKYTTCARVIVTNFVVRPTLLHTTTIRAPLLLKISATKCRLLIWLMRPTACDSSMFGYHHHHRAQCHLLLLKIHVCHDLAFFTFMPAQDSNAAAVIHRCFSKPYNSYSSTTSRRCSATTLTLFPPK